MKRNIRLLFLFLVSIVPNFLLAQQNTGLLSEYRGSVNKGQDLVHTKLELNFDFNKSWLYGNEWLTMQPHFYPSDTVLLDAKGMEIKEVAIVEANNKRKLNYVYDGMQINVKLDRLYSKDEKFTLFFSYISKPDELKVKGSNAISDAKGLYFINPKGDVKNKPTQVWTQGETEANSVWMITIDKPNQKTTAEIAMTIPSKYTTLSNGLKQSEKKNADGTRTDFWKMDLPHAPYLMFMGIGEFTVTKDIPYKGKEVSYYTEPSQAKYAKAVFGNTPEMIKFFSEKLGVDYPWQKYSQIVCRDFVSGAMENTTATLHQESAYQNTRQLADGNAWEETIAHELFHHWFGDLVTAESWSNLTVNESFANYSEYLWDEYKYGKDFADAHNNEDMEGYLQSGSEKKDLVRFAYSDKEDMFDAVSYNKGGRILHMLRNYVGDDAFFASLNNYLTSNKFKTGEASQLRLAFEEVTGKDLNWFWNQWYYGSGHPDLEISYNYSIPGIANTAEVIVKQKQSSGKIFKLPIAVDVYTSGKPSRYNLWLEKASDTFYFKTTAKPDFINVDADKIMLATKTDNKTEKEFVSQYTYAKNYIDRLEALNFFAKNNMPELSKGLNDKFGALRRHTIGKLSATPYKTDKVVLEQIEKIAKTDSDKKTKASAISYLSENGDSKYLPIFQTSVNDSSYSVAAAALKGLLKLDVANAFAIVKLQSRDAKGDLSNVVSDALMGNGSEDDFELVSKMFDESPFSISKVERSAGYAAYLSKINDVQKIKTGVDNMIKVRNAVPAHYKQYTDPGFKAMFDIIVRAKGAAIGDYVNSVFK